MTRRQQLLRNSRRMFAIHALINVRMINIVLSLFFLSRGLSLADIMLSTMFWAGGTLLFEIPSSYLADKWGRKNTLVIGVLFFALQWVLLLFADTFWMVSLAWFVTGIGFAAFSGTDTALLYDTKRELGEEHESLEELGKYAAAKNFFKIGSALIGALIAQHLLPWQFLALLWVDIIACSIALIFAARLVEPNHHMDLCKQEAGVMRDAIALLKKTPLLRMGMLNKEVLFFAFFLLWTYFQVFFHSLGVSIVLLGVGWSLFHFVSFLIKRRLHRFAHTKSIGGRIQVTSVESTLFLGLVVLGIFLHWNAYVVYGFFLLFSIVHGIRLPLFDEFFHSFSNSYNRATTISLTNLLHNVLEIPFIILGTIFIAADPRLPYILAFSMASFTLVVLRIDRTVVKRYSIPNK